MSIPLPADAPILNCLKKNEAKKSNAGQVKNSTFEAQKVKKFTSHLTLQHNWDEHNWDRRN